MPLLQQESKERTMYADRKREAPIDSEAVNRRKFLFVGLVTESANRTFVRGRLPKPVALWALWYTALFDACRVYANVC